MGKAQRDKGNRVERSIVNLFRENGFKALRVPLSGAAQGFKGDIVLEDKYQCECKARKSGGGFVTIEKWLGDNHMLFCIRDRAEALVVMPISVMMGMMKKEDVVNEEPRIRRDKDGRSVRKTEERLLPNTTKNN